MIFQSILFNNLISQIIYKMSHKTLNHCFIESLARLNWKKETET